MIYRQDMTIYNMVDRSIYFVKQEVQGLNSFML